MYNSTFNIQCPNMQMISVKSMFRCPYLNVHCKQFTYIICPYLSILKRGPKTKNPKKNKKKCPHVQKEAQKEAQKNPKKMPICKKKDAPPPKKNLRICIRKTGPHKKCQKKFQQQQRTRANFKASDRYILCKMCSTKKPTVCYQGSSALVTSSPYQGSSALATRGPVTGN